MIPTYAACLQFDVALGAGTDNLALVKDFISGQKPPAGGLIVLPELFYAGFAYSSLADQAAVTPSVLTELVDLAATFEIIIAGSLMERLGDDYYNTMYYCGADGVMGAYRKQRLFAPMDEDRYFRPGDDPRPVKTTMGLMASLVCFDLRFPQLAGVQVGAGAPLLAVCGQWPKARIDHWRILLRARAIENQVFVVACNRCGESAGILFGGSSMIIAPDGEVLAEAGDGQQWLVADLDPERLSLVRSLFTTVLPDPV